MLISKKKLMMELSTIDRWSIPSNHIISPSQSRANGIVFHLFVRFGGVSRCQKCLKTS